MTNTKLPHIAVVGCGAAAREFIIPVLKKYAGFERSVILVDKAEEQARSIAQEFGVQHWCTDYQSLPIDVDAAMITTPHYLHAEQACHFLDQGKHVFVEKPLGMTSAEAERMLDAASSSNATLMVNNYRRLFPAYSRVHQMLQSSQYGDVKEITIHDGTKFAWASVSAFYLRDPRARGVFLDRGAHTVDIVCWWLGGQPKVIDAKWDALGGAEAVMHVELAWRDIPIHLKFSRLNRLENCYAVECEKATIRGGLFDLSRVQVVRNGRTAVEADSPCSYSDCAWRLVENFIDVVLQRESPLFVAADVAPSISVIEQAYERAVAVELPWYEHDPNLKSLREQLAAANPHATRTAGASESPNPNES